MADSTTQLKVFPILYGVDKNKKIREWFIQVENKGEYSVMTYTYGQQNGKKTECAQRISSGKNIGKKNETTHYEQAILEAQSKWTKKRDIEGYKPAEEEVTDKGGAIEAQFENLNLNTDTMYPMLAQDFNKHKNKVAFPCYVQAKLDGYRCTFNTTTNMCISRQGKEFDILKNTKLFEELMVMSKQFKEQVIFDGELYVHEGVFEHLGILRKKKVTAAEEEKLNEIQYHIYDVYVPGHPEMTFEQRHAFLKKNVRDTNFIKLVATIEVKDIDSLRQQHTTFLANNYEGTIVRNKNGIYEIKARSYNLLKYKDFCDKEYKIVDFTSEKDTKKDSPKPLIVWICETEKGLQFNVRPKGDRNERQQLYEKCNKDFTEFKNKNLWVQYFELTDAGVPRFPTTYRNSVSEYIRNIVI